MRITFLAVFFSLVTPLAAAQGNAYWRQAIEHWGRPADFYALAWVAPGRGAVCDAYAKAAAAPARKAPGTSLTANVAMPNMATTTADIAWRTFYSVVAPFVGQHVNSWVIVDLTNNGIERAVVYTRWKGMRDLYLLQPAADNNLIASLHDVLFTEAPFPREAKLEPLALSVPIDRAAAWMTYGRTVDRVIHPIFVRLQGRYYLTVHTEGTGSRGFGMNVLGMDVWQTQRLMILVEFDADVRARALCILRARYPVLFDGP